MRRACRLIISTLASGSWKCYSLDESGLGGHHMRIRLQRWRSQSTICQEQSLSTKDPSTMCYWHGKHGDYVKHVIVAGRWVLLLFG